MELLGERLRDFVKLRGKVFLRFQWFESTPTQASPRAILQVFEPFGGQLGISFPVIYSLHLIYSRS